MGVKSCNNCKHGDIPEFNEPCVSCDHCSNWESLAPQWISVEERLPENGQQVLIYDGNATQWKASVHSARFVKGRTHDEIMVEYRDTGRLWHTFGDEEGNNKKPYAWRGDAHMQWFGQQVTHWMPPPEPPQIKEAMFDG